MMTYSIQVIVVISVLTQVTCNRSFWDICETLQLPGACKDNIDVDEGETLVEFGRPCILYIPQVHDDGPCTEVVIKQDTPDARFFAPDQIVNETAVAVNISLTEPGVWFLSCMANKTTVCTRDLRVGWPAQPPATLKCVSHNLEILACSFTTFENPYLLDAMDYRLALVTTDGNSWHQSEYISEYGCDNISINCWTTKYYSANESYINLSFDILDYYEPGVFFNFTLSNYEIVVPAPVEDLKATEVYPSRILLKMNISESLRSLPQGIYYRVTATPTEPCCNCNVSQVIGDYPNANMPMSMQIEALIDVLLPHTIYNISVDLLSGANIIKAGYDINYPTGANIIKGSKTYPTGDNYTAINQGVDWWSAITSTTLKTRPAVPWSPPRMHNGAFQWTEDNLLVSWQTLLPCHFNANNFQYVVHLYQSSNRILFVKNTTDGFVNFINITESTNYSVKILSTNEVGSSNSTSIMDVSSDRPAAPDFVTAFRRSQDIYTLRWYDFHSSSTESYTVFACLWDNVAPKTPDPCKGRLFWVDLNNLPFSADADDEVTTHIVNITLQEFGISNDQQQNKEYLRFAVSKKAQNGTYSGMIWPKCLPIEDLSKDYGIQFHNISTDSESVTVTWKISCSNFASELQSMVITYCLGNQTNTEKCEGTEHPISNRELAEERVVKMGLQADEQYTINLTAIYREGISYKLDQFHTVPKDLPWWLIALIVLGTISAITTMICILYKGRQIYSKTKEDLNRPLNIPISKEFIKASMEENWNSKMNNSNGKTKTVNKYIKSNIENYHSDSDQFEYLDNIIADKRSIPLGKEINANNIKYFSSSAQELPESPAELSVELNRMPPYISVMSFQQNSQASSKCQSTAEVGITTGYVAAMPNINDFIKPGSEAAVTYDSLSTKSDNVSGQSNANELPSPGYVACVPTTETVFTSLHDAWPSCSKTQPILGYVTCPPHAETAPKSVHHVYSSHSKMSHTPGYVTYPPRDETASTSVDNERQSHAKTLPSPGYVTYPPHAETVSIQDHDTLSSHTKKKLTSGYVMCPPHVETKLIPVHDTLSPHTKTQPIPGYVTCPPYEANVPKSVNDTLVSHTKTVPTPGYVTCPPHTENVPTSVHDTLSYPTTMLPSPGYVTCPPYVDNVSTSVTDTSSHTKQLPIPGYVTCPPYDQNVPASVHDTSSHTKTLPTTGYVTCPPYRENVFTSVNDTSSSHTKTFPTPGYVTCPPSDSNNSLDQSCIAPNFHEKISNKPESAKEKINLKVFPKDSDITSDETKHCTPGYVSVGEMPQIISGMQNVPRTEFGHTMTNDNVSDFELQDDKYFQNMKLLNLYDLMTSNQESEKFNQITHNKTSDIDPKYKFNKDTIDNQVFQSKAKDQTKYGLSVGYVAVQPDDLIIQQITSK